MSDLMLRTYLERIRDDQAELIAFLSDPECEDDLEAYNRARAFLWSVQDRSAGVMMPLAGKQWLLIRDIAAPDDCEPLPVLVLEPRLYDALLSLGGFET